MRIEVALEVTYHPLVLNQRSWGGDVTVLEEDRGGSCAAHFPICLSKKSIFLPFWPEDKDVDGFQNTLLQYMVSWHVEYFKLKEYREAAGTGRSL